MSEEEDKISNLSDGRSWPKIESELETVNKQQLVENFSNDTSTTEVG